MSQNPNMTLSLHFTGSPENVRPALQQVCAALRQVGLSEDDIGTAELVLAEVLNNVIEHAFADRTDGQVNIDFKTLPEGQFFSVRDDGLPMPDGKLPAGIPPEVDCFLENLPEGGWGWSLVHRLTQDICYQRAGQNNVLTFLLPFSAQQTTQRCDLQNG